MVKSYSMFHKVLSDTDWHPVGTVEDRYVLISTGGVPVLTVDLPDGVTPELEVSPTFILGGIVNGSTSEAGKQTWCRVRHGIGQLSYHLYDADGFDEISALRSSVVDLGAQVIGLANRTHVLEINSDSYQRWIEAAEYVITSVQGHMAKLYSIFTAHQARNLQFQAYIRNYVSRVLYTSQTSLFDNIKAMTNDLTTTVAENDANFKTFCEGLNTMMKVNDEISLEIIYDDLIRNTNTNESIRPTLLDVKELVRSKIKADLTADMTGSLQANVSYIYAMCTKLLLADITNKSKMREEIKSKIVTQRDEFNTQVNLISNDLNALRVFTGMDAGDGDNDSLEEALTADNLATYWQALMDFADATSVPELQDKYAAMISDPRINSNFEPVISAICRIVNDVLTMATWISGVVQPTEGGIIATE